jgi:hypothetical protein
VALQDQVDAVLAQQGGDADEDELSSSGVTEYEGPPSSPGLNSTYLVLLDSGTVAFHKPRLGVNTVYADA